MFQTNDVVDLQGTPATVVNVASPTWVVVTINQKYAVLSLVSLRTGKLGAIKYLTDHSMYAPVRLFTSGKWQHAHTDYLTLLEDIKCYDIGYSLPTVHPFILRHMDRCELHETTDLLLSRYTGKLEIHYVSLALKSQVLYKLPNVIVSPDVSNTAKSLTNTIRDLMSKENKHTQKALHILLYELGAMI